MTREHNRQFKRQFPATATPGLRQTPDSPATRSETAQGRQPGEATEQFLFEILDEKTGLIFVKHSPEWVANRIWEPIGSVRLTAGTRSQIIQALSGIAIGEIQAEELDDIRVEIGSE